MTDGPRVLSLWDCRELALVGGKAINLARLVQAGFPVPDGFVVTTAAFLGARNAGSMPQALADEIAAAYRRMGSPPVAVRSSATAEDMAGASMAGQYETFLDVVGERAVVDAVKRCWDSLGSERIRAYLAQHDIDISEVAMGVVVQRLVPSDVAGVLFTVNPRTGSREEMLLEASWGLGEAVVSGAVQPDTLVLDRATGAVKQSVVNDKQVWFEAGSGSHQAAPVPDARRRMPCLTAQNVHELWHLGLKVMEHFGSAQDIEWAIQGGRLFLLQSRAVTTLEEAEALGECLKQAREQLLSAKAAGRGDWVRHNISETIPHPTPLTWSVIRRFMSGDGGFGAMYRMVGFEPDEPVRHDGFLDLIAGRIYMDLSRGPGMFFHDFPYRYDLELLRSNPDASQGPPTVPAGSLLSQFRLGRKLGRINGRIEELAETYDREFDEKLAPELRTYVQAEKARDLSRLTVPEWLELWAQRERVVMDEFAPRSLLPSLMAAMAADKLRTFVEEHEWDADSQAVANLLVAGAQPDLTLQANQALWDLAQGRTSVKDWLDTYGHRAPEEFDLWAPRWRERPEALTAMAEHLKGSPSPMELHARRAKQAAEGLAALERKLTASQTRRLGELVCLARRYMRFREDGKHFLMMGYDLLRDMAVDAARRLGVTDEVFLLSFDELRDALVTGFAPLHLIEQRRMQRAAQAKVTLGHVITQDDIPNLGLRPRAEGGNRCPAFPISAGVAAGPARIVFSPNEAGDLGKGYVLVCPSTDPSWTPLFVNACALVLECGGTLSHGAVVAREMGIPAVVCNGATRLFQDGESITIDGDAGAIIRGSPQQHGEGQAAPSQDPADTRVPRELVPPAPGAGERSSAKLRNVFLGIWAAYFVWAFLLPGTWIYDRSMDLLDRVLWPVFRNAGAQGTVVVIAGVLAAFTMIGQWLLTDNRRLRVAKKRAGALRKLSTELPKDSPRAKALLALAAPVQTRVTMAAFVSLAIILGPMVMSFLWLPSRVDPASWNARPGVTAYVTAEVSGEFTKPITIEYDPALKLDESTPASQSLPAIRPVLEERLAQWRKRSNLTSQPWELREAGDLTGRMLVESLSDYLKHDLPPSPILWTLTTPAKAGSYKVTLKAEGMSPLTADVVVGEGAPPPVKEDLGDGKGPVQVVRPASFSHPVRLLKVAYAESSKKKEDTRFWAPFAAFDWNWDAGWLWMYIVVYVPIMFLLRAVLRIA